MLGIEDYGSASENDSESEGSRSAPKKLASSGSLPPSTSKSALPPKGKRSKKITISLPSLSTLGDNEDDSLNDDRPSLKKPRLELGAGSSSLVTMLPAPKRDNPSYPVLGRVLGGKGSGLAINASRPSDGESDEIMGVSQTQHERSIESSALDSTAPLLFLPSSLKKGQSVQESKSKLPMQAAPKQATTSTIDFFSLGHTSSLTPNITPSASSNLTSVISPLSSAPTIPTFEPPEPSPSDEYPGYYQLPSGTWAAHDPAYFATFVKKWQSEYDAQVRMLEKGMAKGFEGLEKAVVEEVDAMKTMEKAKVEIKEREERKAVTHGATGEPVAPKMNITASKMSGIARSRHQLSTLLKEAYENREALEEKIAQGKRNRKEAGNKYGF